MSSLRPAAPPGGEADAGGRVAPGRTAPRVLIVDDQPANLLALEGALDPLGLEFVRARSCDDALRSALGRDFDLLLLDVQMPDADGFETARLLRQRPALRATPILFLSAEPPTAADLERVRQEGGLDFLVKPLDVDVLRVKVASALGRSPRGS
jgi:CheY-like chemotaxis protein